MLLSARLQTALVEAAGRKEIVVRWRKGSRLTVWIFRVVTSPSGEIPPIQEAVAVGVTSYDVPSPRLKPRKPRHIGGTELVLVGYGLGYRNWRRDPLHRDVFTAVEIHAATKGYVKVVFDLMQEIVYPVMFKRLVGTKGKKKVSRPTSKLYSNAIPMAKFNRTVGRKFGVKLTPEKKPRTAIDQTRRQVIEK